MTNFYPFIQGSLEWPFSELFSISVSLWNQYKYGAFNIFSCTIVIISCKVLIIPGMSKHHNILPISASLFQVQKKLKVLKMKLFE